nr:MAG TPA: hypothetical protein [Bacteriophage sp.]
MTYQQGKERARERAIEWQLDFDNHTYSYGELADFCEYTRKRTGAGARYRVAT